jgi:hypothetical protein
MFGEEIMGRKRYQLEKIIGKLRESKILLANAGFGAMSPYYSLFKIVPNFSNKHKSFIKKDFPCQNK